MAVRAPAVSGWKAATGGGRSPASYLAFPRPAGAAIILPETVFVSEISVKYSNKRRIILAAIAFVAVAAASWLAIRPAAAVLLCPDCFGFERIGPNIYVEESMAQDRRQALIQSVETARRRIADFYGTRLSDPRILGCGSEACYWRVGGVSAKGAAWGSIGVRLSPRGLSPTVVSHEMAHIELHHRLGLLRLSTGAIPSWFDEGLAALISDDRRYLNAAGEGDRCVIESSDGLPAGFREWRKRAGQDGNLYAKAACQVWRWFDSAGAAGVMKLIDDVRDGVPFSIAYAHG